MKAATLGGGGPPSEGGGLILEKPIKRSAHGKIFLTRSQFANRKKVSEEDFANFVSEEVSSSLCSELRRRIGAHTLSILSFRCSRSTLTSRGMHP
jgi:hypothetical protein